MNSTPLSFAVVGMGHIGKRHAEMVRRQPDCTFVAGCDIRPAEVLGLQGDVPFYSNLSAMLAAHPDVDVVSICTPNGRHAEQALEVLEAGHHVIIEKPMALTRNDGERLLHKALEVGRQVFCVMQNRYSPPSIWLKGLVDSGKLGKIHMVQVNCFWNRDDRYYSKIPWKGTLDMDGGTLFTQFSHFVDIVYWLFGDMEHFHARFADFNHQHNTDFEDSGLVSFAFVQGGLGTLQFSTAVADANFESSLTIIAENGTVKVGGQYMNEIEYCHIRDYTMPELPASNPANDYGHYKGSAANHGYVFQNVYDTLRGKGKISTNALEGLKVVDIIERIYAAADRGLKVPLRQGERSVS